MRIHGLPSFEPIATPTASPASAPQGGPHGADEASSFSGMVTHAIAGAAATQAAGDAEAEKLARGEGNLHDAALALEKADISMRLMTKARNKIVEAYQEIMRTPV